MSSSSSVEDGDGLELNEYVRLEQVRDTDQRGGRQRVR